MIHLTRRGLFAAGLITGTALMPLVTSSAANRADGPVPVAYKSITIGALDIAYREAGPNTGPVVLLLHGFPSSSHMFRDLMPLLGRHYRVIAPDYPGFGSSSAPALAEFPYTFAAMADVVDMFADKVGAKDYVLFMQDYGGPIGFRLAVRHPEKVRGLIIQNAVASVESWNPDVVRQFAPFWQARSGETEKPVRAMLTLETTKFQYTHGAARLDRVSPDAWIHDQVNLDKPGNADLQVQMLFNYQDNVAQYPVWQAYLQQHQPRTLIVWGKNDPFFRLEGVDYFKSQVPNAEVHLYDAGHFALETHVEEIADATLAFLAAAPKVK